MSLSRRRFLTVAAALPLAVHQLCPERREGGVVGNTSALPGHSARPGCLLADVGEHCTLRESLDGFVRGLAAASIRFQRVTTQAIQPARFIVVAGAVLRSSGFARTLRDLAGRGTTVIYESGAAYAEPEAFAAERYLLRSYFGLRVQAPAELWPSRPGSFRPGYVHYRWPAKVMVRDFSRVIPISKGGINVARLGDASVASRLRVGNGAFIFLGSPLGPHLGSGDPEAQALLQALVVPR